MPANFKRRFSLLDRFHDHLHMGPRKKNKPNPQAPPAQNAQALEDPSQPSPEAVGASESAQPQGEAAKPDESRNTQSGGPRKGSATRKSWYSGGSWKAKASPIAQVAKESISSAAGGITSDTSSQASKQDATPGIPAKLLPGGMRRSSKSTALAASTTTVNATSSHANDSKTSLVSDTKKAVKEGEADPPLPPDPVGNDAKPTATVKEDITRETEGPKPENKEVKPASGSLRGWYGWWSRPENYQTESNDAKTPDNQVSADTEGAQQVPLPEDTPMEEAPGPDSGPGESGEMQTGPDPNQSMENGVPTQDDGSQQGMVSKGWFWIWSAAQNARSTAAAMAGARQEPNATTAEETDTSENAAGTEPRDIPKATSQEVTQEDPSDNAQNAAQTSEAEPQQIPKKSTGWAFWSRAQAKDDSASEAGSTHKQVGELAVADTPSASHPEAAQFNEHEEEQAKEQTKAPVRALSLRGRRGKGPNADGKPTTPVKTTPSHSPARSATEAAKVGETAPVTPATPTTSKQAQKSQANPNLILPEFRSTYSLSQMPSYWDKVRRYFLGAGEPESPHLHIEREPARIQKALAIGVHGYFPAPLIQKVLGQPTGTSIRFANAAATALRSWTESHGYSCEVEKVALEGEGFVSDRVDTLWKLLLNWIEHIRNADVILVACHSQGVPVAIMLVAKLIQFGCVNTTKIGVCAMAGVNLGPFPEYKSRFFGGSAGELFEFSRPNSVVSQKYQGALRVVLSYGVKILYVGSIDDQLVSLESSTFSNISHPYIYRSVFVDGRIHAPDFITHLVGFALKLRNLGLPDHGLIRELSPALAGSLYSGEGHSRIYDDPNVYTLAVQHTLETTSLPYALNPPLHIKDFEGVGTVGSNPFFLPWAMRGLLEEDFVRKELSAEVEGLLNLFEDWKPNTKPLKDIRFRLEAVRSKL
ncbi:uncharacterized protein K452DRAFT_230459 [Aplosporella prunicola CBS 121167]|uniref:YMC020W-like alpha/beta hydrolase domain-containing protein n=1 Tax=Aplosporella prunicola CBS 121167 TaxID=1176127 RepID=A0A6A6BAB8_9PEZI|nr:uncharacterized protein K452DRAFT_230459 [Aplosporella prunicola CBS 121167]KAF2140528.1 hypothetical protein K452DRAFT_230459 [Aplosporella prunicola CBS 121167]